MVVLRNLILTAAMATAGTASAHVAVQPTTGTAGGYQVLRFGAGHGCDGKATTQVSIAIPASVQSARPQPKPGWTLDIQHAAGDADKVTAITWTGSLPADQFDEFLIQVHFPASDAPVSVAFPTTQSCGTSKVLWADGDPAHPAPKVALTPPPASPEAGHDHHH